MDNIGVLIRKFSVPALFIIIGLGVLIFGFSSDQNGFFKFSAGMMLAAGVLSALFSLGKLRPIVVIGTGVLFGVVAALLLFYSYKTVSTTLTYEKDRTLCMEMAKQNLTDIRFLQKIHHEKTGKYINNWEDLVDFAKNGTMPQLISKGTVPSEKITSEERDYLYGDNRPIDNKMTEEEALRLSKWKEGPRYHELFEGFVRDTQQVRILTRKFRSKSYMENRIKNDLGSFDPEALPYIPFTDNKEKWDLKVKDSVTIGDLTGSAIYVGGSIPFGPFEDSKYRIVVEFGSKTLSTLDTEGSWEKDE